MNSPKLYDVAIIGGGIVGVATALSLVQKKNLSVIILEAEQKLAAHQTGHNSGVIHSGLYYKPGSRKAKNCTEGRALMYAFCEQHSIPYERCGKVVVAVDDTEIPMLNTLEERGKHNGLQGMIRLNGEALHEYEPNVVGQEGLFVPHTGIVDYPAVVEVCARLFQEQGGEIALSTRFLSVVRERHHFVLETSAGEIRAAVLVNCGGLRCDEIAERCGVTTGIQIIPFRGEYYQLTKEKESLVRNLIYPVPDPRYPFLGVHFTRMIGGGVEAGPNAVLAYKKEGYAKSDISLSDMLRMSTFPGFWKMARQHFRMGFAEFRRSYSKTLFVHSLQKLIPAITENDVYASGSGVRAQALDSSGKLLDDFSIKETPKMVHVLNAPSPAATSSFSIGNTISEKILTHLE